MLLSGPSRAQRESMKNDLMRELSSIIKELLGEEEIQDLSLSGLGGLGAKLG